MRHSLIYTTLLTPMMLASLALPLAQIATAQTAADQNAPAPSADPPSPAAAQSQENKSKQSEAGELLFNNACRTCHAVKVGDHRLGPSLAAIVGRKAASQSGYTYSPSLKNSGLTWDEKTLDAFIANPDAVAPGNNMKPYTGMTNAEDRAKIVTYLRSGAASSSN